MSTYHIDVFFHFSRKSKLFLLAFFSFSGILLGVSISYRADPFFFSLMHRIAFDSVSIVGLAIVGFLPLLITAVIVLLSKPYLFIPLAFVKNFSYAFVRSFICISFSHAGWLVGFMLLFSDTIVICLLHWYWVRHIQGVQQSAARDMVLCSAVSLIACVIDYIWVSPFLVTLLND